MIYFLIFHIYYNFMVLELVMGPTDNTYETVSTVKSVLKLQYTQNYLASSQIFTPFPHPHSLI